jgi:hypothetical protein
MAACLAAVVDPGPAYGSLLGEGTKWREIPDHPDSQFVGVNVPLADEQLRGAQVIELGDDDYMILGMFDLHTHYALDLRGEGRVDDTSVYPVLFIANGVTSTFPAGEVQPEKMRDLRKRIERGEQIGWAPDNRRIAFVSATPGPEPNQAGPAGAPSTMPSTGAGDFEPAVTAPYSCGSKDLVASHAAAMPRNTNANADLEGILHMESTPG